MHLSFLLLKSLVTVESFKSGGGATECLFWDSTEAWKLEMFSYERVKGLGSVRLLVSLQIFQWVLKFFRGVWAKFQIPPLPQRDVCYKSCRGSFVTACSQIGMVWSQFWVREAPFWNVLVRCGHCPNSFRPLPSVKRSNVEKKCPKPSWQALTPPANVEKKCSKPS